MIMKSILGVALLLAALTSPFALADGGNGTNPHGPGNFNGEGTVDMAELEKLLTTTGLPGWIHGAAGDLEQYVFTWRDANDFFTYAIFSVTTHDAKVRELLHTLNRHDKVLVKGVFADNPSPQKHIDATEISVLKRYDPTASPTWPAGAPLPPHHPREAQLPDELLGRNELIATVHAAPEEGGVLVVEYKDTVVPVFVENNTYTKGLFRGDKVRLHYKVLSLPRKPTHLMLDTSAAKPLEVTDAVAKLNGQDLTLEGALVYFPKSPEISFDVYALQVVDSDGLKRNFTLVNLEDADVFKAIRLKLQGIWQANVATQEDGRNCFINRKIRLRAKGKGNVISPSQANPQILLSSAEAIEVLPTAR